jgi:hypothetical protein
MLNYNFPWDDISGLQCYDGLEIQKAFDYIAKDTKLEFDYPQGGCQQRSHVISMILSKIFRIEHCKIWLFAPASLYDYDNRTLFVEDKNKLSPNNNVEWNYHTAPLIKRIQGNTIDFLIIDPSLNNIKPMTLNEWLESIGNSNLGLYTFLMPEKYFFNCKYNGFSELTNVFDGTFFEYTNPAKDNLAVEKGLAINDMAMVVYRKYIQPLLDRPDAHNNHKLQDLKDIFGNATALDLFFAQNLSGNTPNTSYRYIVANYGVIVKEAKSIFYKQLIYWTEFTNKLLD